MTLILCLRPSVIVHTQSYEEKSHHEPEEIICSVVLTIHEIENMYLQEEENYVKQLTSMFMGRVFFLPSG